MKKFFVVLSVVFVLFTFSGCNVCAGEFEPTNPWVWWVVDCKPLH